MERFAIKFDESVPFNLRKVCRLCGTGAGVIPILENKMIFEDDEDAELSKKIQTCVGIKVSLIMCIMYFHKIYLNYNHSKIAEKNNNLVICSVKCTYVFLYAKNIPRQKFQ